MAAEHSRVSPGSTSDLPLLDRARMRAPRAEFDEVWHEHTFRSDHYVSPPELFRLFCDAQSVGCGERAGPGTAWFQGAGNDESRFRMDVGSCGQSRHHTR